MTSLRLPTENGAMERYTLGAPTRFPDRPRNHFNRIAYAAGHVVADPLSQADPWLEPAIDWDRTLAFRHTLWDLGFGVAEAMDTAQRGMGLAWTEAQELIRRSLREAQAHGDAMIACGVGTDHLAPGPDVTLDQVIRAYEEQAEVVESLNGRMIVMSSRALAAAAESPDDYAKVYGRLLSQIKQPVIVHWLGEMFDPALAGYWGRSDHAQAMDVCLDVLAANAQKVDGIKLSLLDKEKELSMRRRLPKGVRMYTGDDFNFAELIAGDTEGYSDALLGVFDPIAPAASAALDALAEGKEKRFHEILEPTVPLARLIFSAPTRFYKTGVVFLAYLNGFQDHFVMVGGQESARNILHLSELLRLADQAGLLRDPDTVAQRMRAVLESHGITQE
ncbi:dihydrodipicolinate synthase family protein [Rhodovibrio salinarum]|uniref:Dihydrodipicolinate synthase family protein n=1 Tax=Rhodovibrio salinarum TaxID=1087 RepID=A0A934QIK6_9PROT|nr:dihydrodipicolinate synthase family protein [Rhodovibrio salinarum]MBK1697220.1 dihydrodipicolinate synthase family protein [Rhodovibrio salinarum]